MTIDPLLLDTIDWRQVGPFRGGRVVAVAGDPVSYQVFYFGACSGGIWKTEDGGTYWENVSDGFLNTSSIGAIAVSSSDPNVIYAGTGEACIRGNVSQGDGVYKSTDAGKTWYSVGLKDTRHIGRIRIHPSNPDVVYVAGLGNAFGNNPDRGVFRSKDGGETWEKVLFRSDKAGAIDLSMDPHNPRIVYATLWETLRQPWTMTSGGSDSGIFKSTDGGDNWIEITRNSGLPKGTIGRVGIAVSPAKRERVWALIEAVYEDAGLYRSDDAGASWERINPSRELVQRPWYYSHVFADPQDPETVFVMNLKAWRSTDGGRNFDEITMPHGDNHDLWIDSNDTRRMIQGNDGGACVTFNAGETWSSIYNQPTSQFYHIDVDNQFPYRIYATQQDNSAISSPSRSLNGPINWSDCYPCGNAESGYVAVRPDNANIVYTGAIGSSPGGGDSLLRYDHETGQVRIVSIWPEASYGLGVDELKYRFQWTYPIVISPHDPEVIYACANVVFRSDDDGSSWNIISPDLTRNDRSKMGRSGGPLTGDMTGVEHYGTIFAFSESHHDAGVFWAASDDGLVHLSQDHGKTWNDVTPQCLPDDALIGTLECSIHDPDTLYLSATRYKFDDTKPYLLKTNDSGTTWTKITDGIPDDDFTRVIREDRMRRGLLYAGTETGIYISYDDGASWQSLRGNTSTGQGQPLPIVPVHDLKIKGNELVAGTHGRSFWILDDLALVRQLDGPREDEAILFQPAPTYRIASPMDIARPTAKGKNYHVTLGVRGVFYDRTMTDGTSRRIFLDSGTNPPNGVVIDYWLKEAHSDDRIKLSLTHPNGALINSYITNDKSENANFDDPSLQTSTITAVAGMNRFVWDMHYPDGPQVPGDKLAEKGVKGPLVTPGNYKVNLSIGENTYSKGIELLPDPRIYTSQEDYEEQLSLLLRIQEKMTETNRGINRLRNTRTQMDELTTRASGNESWKAISENTKRVKDKLPDIEEALINTKSVKGSDQINAGTRLNVKLAELTSVVSSADSAPTKQSYEVFEDLSDRIDRQLSRLQEVIDTDVKELIDLSHELEIPPIVPSPT